MPPAGRLRDALQLIPTRHSGRRRRGRRDRSRGYRAPCRPDAGGRSDAELLRLCAEFDALERAYKKIDFNAPVGSAREAAAEAEQDSIRAAQADLVERMHDCRAVTLARHMARARSYVVWAAGDPLECIGDTESTLVSAIFRDLSRQPVWPTSEGIA